ncbi:hypothetical protein [Methylocystis parvus]|uniref:Uncharacterized protein n=1 Tax=Methylocystis parvus TaxID=134 RepID=A0A6B8M5V0_9HYPH|nr:hypothetical protein [Methylocystis parvus]QGM97109.1 hypothetical protein F7D14_06215 [Methylocystis parvus]WBJ98988.1 hypothetical protein MMG94_13395 [Methylocystis parvus OBBP]
MESLNFDFARGRFASSPLVTAPALAFYAIGAAIPSLASISTPAPARPGFSSAPERGFPSSPWV